MDPHHRKRCKRYDVPGDAHYLTFSCFHRQPFLDLDTPRHWLMDSLNKARTKIAFDLWAWVIMPEHVHLLVWPREGAPVSEVLRHVKLPVTKKAFLWAPREHPGLLAQMADKDPKGKTAYRFWQRGGGYDRNIWSATETHEKIGYIHANPVRRGLVARPQDWPWSSWAAWNEPDEATVRIDKENVPPLDR